MSLLNNSIFSSAPPSLSLDDIRSVVHEHYGWTIDQDIILLGSERDQNAIICIEGRRLVFRVTNRAELRKVTHLQTSALMHVQRAAPAFPIQHIVPTLDGRTEVALRAALGGHVVRIMTYLEGVPLSSIRHRTPLHRERVGEALGGLAIALEKFTHPSVNHDLIWNVVKASQVRELLEKIEDAGKRSLAKRFLDEFERHTCDLLPTLRSQVIHNDLNPHNILFASEKDAKVTGVLDFGDIILNPIVVDVAVAASSQMAGSVDPLVGPGDVIRGFHSVFALTETEIDAIFDLMAARLVLNVTITGWRALLYPSMREYILKNNRISWETLDAFQTVDRKKAQEYFKSICQRKQVHGES